MDELLARYQQRLHLQNATFTKVEHEDAIVATVYQVTLASGKHLILKICKWPRHYLREVYFLNFFAGKAPVPRIVETIVPDQEMYGAVLMECLPGRVGKIADFRGDLAFELGMVLGCVHSHSSSGFGELINQSSLQQDAKFFFGSKFEEIISECTSHFPLFLMNECQQYYNTHCHLLDSVDGPCVVHRDFRPGNVMIDKGKIQGIIDWSSAVSGFAEEDFCSMEHGEWSIDPTGKSSFMEGYKSIRPVPNYEPIMPFLRISKALHIIGFLVKIGTWDKEQSQLYQSNRQYLEGFFSMS